VRPFGLGLSHHSFYTSSEEPPLSIFNSYWDIPEAQLARRIQARRADARSGDILGLAAGHIRNLVSGEIAGAKGNAVLSSIEQTNIHGVKLRVNHRYPPALPRVTMPSPILAKLPPVPSELEYRFLGRSLVLVDTECALVVDVLPDVLPPPLRSRR
jgi:hypothetical protein